MLKNRLNGTMKRKGFTLPEILVSITLVAILAAVVVPTITSQVKKGDPTRVGNEYMAVRGGVEQFLSDVRRYPASIGQLTNTISTSNAPLNGTALANYGAPEVARWRGPYITKDSIAGALTGYGLSFNTKFDTVTLAQSGSSSCSGVGCGQKYMSLAIPMPNNDSLTALELDRQFDDGVLLTGSIRYRVCTATAPAACSPSSSKDTIKLLLMPIY